MRNRKTGRMAPVDVAKGEKGNCVIDLTDMSYAVVDPYRGGYTVHHATCPDVARFKGRGKK